MSDAGDGSELATASCELFAATRAQAAAVEEWALAVSHVDRAQSAVDEKRRRCDESLLEVGRLSALVARLEQSAAIGTTARA